MGGLTHMWAVPATPRGSLLEKGRVLFNQTAGSTEEKDKSEETEDKQTYLYYLEVNSALSKC